MGLCVIPLEQVLVWDSFTLEHGQLQFYEIKCVYVTLMKLTARFKCLILYNLFQFEPVPSQP
jgi:hypothetical protein